VAHAFSSPWGGRPPLRRGYAAVPPTRRLARASGSFRYRSNWGIIGALSKHNRAKFGMGQHHQKWGFHKGENTSRHQTQNSVDIPDTVDTPDTKHRDTPDTKHCRHTRHQKSKHQTPNIKTRFASILFCGRTQGSKPLNRAFGPVHSFEINDSNLT
jgi:hypothetical protein